MKKRLIAVVFIAITIFLITSCTKPESEIEIYSFSGENKNITINNGLIIVTDDLEKFIGGDLSFKNNGPSNIKESSEKFFFDKDGKEDAILSNATTVEGSNKGTQISSELGTISSEDLFYGNDLELIKDSLKFSLSGKLMNGESFEYKLDLVVKKAY